MSLEGVLIMKDVKGPKKFEINRPKRHEFKKEETPASKDDAITENLKSETPEEKVEEPVKEKEVVKDPPTRNPYRVIVSALNIRVTPSDDGDIMCVLKKDTPLIINSMEGEWANVTAIPVTGIEVTGYVMTKFIEEDK